MTTTARTAGKLGRLAARRPVGLQDLSRYLTGPLPDVPAEVTPPSLADWGMLDNDKLGDCTIAGYAHLDMAVAFANGETAPAYTTEQASTIYLQLGHGQDNGLVEADVLAYAKATGIFGTRDKAFGYAPLTGKGDEELRQVIALFGGAYLGVSMPAVAMDQFNEGEPWDLTGTSADNDIEGGHCVPAVGYKDSYWVVTWAKLQEVTERWMARYLEEKWAVVNYDEPAVNDAALEPALRAAPLMHHRRVSDELAGR